VGGFPEPPVHDWDALYRIVDTLRTVAGDLNCQPSQVALAWLLHRRAVTSVIIGGRTEAHFRQNLAASDIRLAGEHLAQLNEASAQPLRYPYWHQLSSMADRLGPADIRRPQE
jgi:aryl-alcohol dehydrogenase-like predicted oxidoreductase